MDEELANQTLFVRAPSSTTINFAVSAYATDIPAARTIRSIAFTLFVSHFSSAVVCKFLSVSSKAGAMHANRLMNDSRPYTEHHLARHAKIVELQ